MDESENYYIAVTWGKYQNETESHNKRPYGL